MLASCAAVQAVDAPLQARPVAVLTRTTLPAVPEMFRPLFVTSPATGSGLPVVVTSCTR